MKKYLVNICLLIFCMFLLGKQCYAEENLGQIIEVVLLIDTSKTMLNYEEALKNWSEDFCYNCSGKNIILSYVTFDNANNEKEVVTKTKMDERTYKEYVPKIQAIEITGDDTDQLGAFEKAKEILENSNADIKYIIMLSDGQIDYRKFGKKDENGNTIYKNCAKELLKNSCKNFTGKNQRVILVGFGKDIKLFNNIVKYDNKEDRKQLRIQYIDSHHKPSDIIKKFLTGTGNLKKILQKDKEEDEKEKTPRNNITFTLPKKYNLIDVYIESLDNNKIDFSRGISIKYNSKELEKDKWVSQEKGKYLKVMFRPPEEGEYKIVLPEERKWRYKVSYWYTQIEKVELKLLSGDEEIEISNKDEIVLYEPGIFYSDLKLRAELHINEEAEKNNIKSKKVCYLNTDENSDADMEKLWNDESKVNTMAQIPNSGWEYIYILGKTLDENNNIYQTRVYLPDGSHINSNKIKIVPKKEEIKIYPLNAITGNKNDLVSLVPKEYREYIDNIKFAIDGEVLDNTIDNEIYSSENDGKIVTFKETGKYTIDMQNKNNDIFAKVEVNVNDDVVYKLFSFIKGNRIYGIIIVMSIAIVAFIISLARKSKK